MSGMIDILTTRVLMMSGIFPNTKGFHYLRTAIAVYLELPADTVCTAREIYSETARRYSTTYSAVERAVRHAIISGWHRRDSERTREIFFNLLQSPDDVPSSTLFISAAAEWVRRSLNNE